jgi:hypothetical protein
MTNTPAKKPAATRAAKPKPEPTPTPSEAVDAAIEREELRRELLADLPALRPAYRFRLAHRNAFHNLSLEAIKSGAFDRDDMAYDLSKPKDIEDFQKLQKFVESIDEWAESIAEDKDAYIAWSEGKDEETFMALFATYRADLGE